MVVIGVPPTAGEEDEEDGEEDRVAVSAGAAVAAAADRAEAGIGASCREVRRR